MAEAAERIRAPWLEDAAARAVTAALEAGGHHALFVGGCVRNALLGAPVTDLDLATDARPERVTELAEAAGLRPVPTGIEHGTITVVHKGHPIEVTTFRADIDTDGRRATVRFTDDVAEDAARRDFTMNALYADARGRVIDPLGGLPDLRARRVRFVGDPTQRVHEDYLRILRFFRFYAWYADPAEGLDSEGLAACAAGVEGLARVSAERIGGEMKRLLAAPDPGPALAAMAQAGILAAILPGADAQAVVRLAAQAPEPDPIARLAALGGASAETRLRLSRAEAKRLQALRSAATGDAGPAELGWRLGAEEGAWALSIRAALTGAPVPGGAEAALARGAQATFPVTAADLMPDYRGAALGARLKRLEAAWLASDLRAGREDLLALPDDDGQS